MRNLSLSTLPIGLLLMACSPSSADTNFEQSASNENQTQSASQVSTSKAGLFEDKRVKEYLKSMEESINAMSLFYSRLSPEVAAHIKTVSLPPEAKDVARCIVKESKANGLEKQFDKSLQESRQFVNYIKNTPSLTVTTLESDEVFTKMQSDMMSPEFAPLIEITKSCGGIEMNMALSRQTGVFEAIKHVGQ